MNRSISIAIAGMLVGAGYVFVNIDDLLKPKDAPLAKLKSKSGKVEMRPIDLTIWRNVESDQLFYSGDVISTDTGGQAEIVFLKGRRIVLDELSQVVIRAQRQTGDEDLISIRLIKGQVQTRFKPRANQTTQPNRGDRQTTFQLIAGQQTLRLNNVEAKVSKQVGKKTAIQIQSGRLLLSEGRKAPKVLDRLTNPVVATAPIPLIQQPAAISPTPDPLDKLNLDLKLTQPGPVLRGKLEIASPQPGFYFASAKSVTIPIVVEKPRRRSRAPYTVRISVNGQKKQIRSNQLTTDVPITLTNLMNEVTVQVGQRGRRPSDPTSFRLTSLPHAIERGKWIGIDQIERTRPAAVFRQKKFGKPEAYIRFESTKDLRPDSAILRNASVLTLADRPPTDRTNAYLIKNHDLIATVKGSRKIASRLSAAKRLEFAFEGDLQSFMPAKGNVNKQLIQAFNTYDQLYLMNDRKLFHLKKKTLFLIPSLLRLMGPNVRGIFKDPVRIVWSQAQQNRLQ